MYAHILVSTDGSELAGKGLQEGLALAKALGAEVTILTVSEPWPTGLGIADKTILDDWERDCDAKAKAVLSASTKTATEAGVSTKAVYVAGKHPADAIMEYVERHEIDLIIMASHGRRGFQRLMLGSQTAGVLSRSPVPVLVVR